MLPVLKLFGLFVIDTTTNFVKSFMTAYRERRVSGDTAATVGTGLCRQGV